MSHKYYLLLTYTFICMILFWRSIHLSFQSHQMCILSAGLGMARNRDGLSCKILCWCCTRELIVTLFAVLIKEDFIIFFLLPIVDRCWVWSTQGLLYTLGGGQTATTITYIYLSICLYIYKSIYLSIYLSICTHWEEDKLPQL